jgi:exosortase A-associated hydrolase 2
MTGRVRAQFIDGSAGRIFSVLRMADTVGRDGGSVLFVPPFAEEMNKCRRQMAETAIALAQRGISSLVLDLYGTGDSEGEFAEARWETWQADIATAIEWARLNGMEFGATIAIRLGCALAARSLAESGVKLSASVFWQPLEGGERMMSQFLRLRIAASMMEADKRETLDELAERLEGGETIEVAGYDLAPPLWRSIRSLDAEDCLDSSLGDLLIAEVGRRGGEALSASGQRLIDAAGRGGISATGLHLDGDAFWRSTETVVNPALADATAVYLASRL